MKLFFYDGYYIPIAIVNPLTGKRYPDEGEVLALIDTGFNGFLIIAEDIFGELGCVAYEKAKILGICCKVEAEKSPIRIIIPELNLIVDGECLTYDGAKEILLGIEAISKLKLILNGCKNEGIALRCDY